MSQKEKMKLLKKESPELLELIQDFKKKVTVIRQTYGCRNKWLYLNVYFSDNMTGAAYRIKGRAAASCTDGHRWKDPTWKG